MLLLNYSSFAQRIELTATGGYQYWGSYKYYDNYNRTNGKLSLGGGACYGGILGFELFQSCTEIKIKLKNNLVYVGLHAYK